MYFINNTTTQLNSLSTQVLNSYVRTQTRYINRADRTQAQTRTLFD